MAKMKAVQLPKAGADFEIVERWATRTPADSEDTLLSPNSAACVP